MLPGAFGSAVIDLVAVAVAVVQLHFVAGPPCAAVAAVGVTPHSAGAAAAVAVTRLVAVGSIVAAAAAVDTVELHSGFAS